MTNTLLECIQKLIDEGKGDPGRLNHILETLYTFDKKYLKKLIQEYLE